MAKLTLFELHIDGVDITAPEFGAGGDETEGESAESDGRLGTALFAVGTLAVLAVIAVVAKQRLGATGETTPLDTDGE